jgi:hypothetical protein
MKSLVTYILENEIQPAVTVFYRANIGKNNEYDEKIGDVTEISFRYQSSYNKKLIFSELIGRDWKYALEMDIKDNDSLNNFKKYLADKNKNDKFYQYFIDEKDAIKAADKAKKEYENKKWTLNTLLSAIKKDRDLMSLKYNYRITDTSTQVDRTPIESIYVSGSWRITIVNNKIHVKNAGWHTYEVPNLSSLYKVLSADNGSEDDETQRCEYSIVI